MLDGEEELHRDAIGSLGDAEDALPADHRARLLWQVVGTLDLSGFMRDAKAVEGRQGRNVLSVRMQLTLWLYAISIGEAEPRKGIRRTSW